VKTINTTKMMTILLATILTGCGGGGSSDSESATPTQTTRYTITTSVEGNGSVNPASVTVDEGSSQSFTLTPDEGYRIESASGCNGSLSDTTYTIDSVQENCEVQVQFLATQTISEILLSLDYQILIADSISAFHPESSATDSTGNLITRSIDYSYFVDNQAAGDDFTRAAAGSYQVSSIAEGITSNYVEVQYRQPPTLEQIEIPVVFVLAHMGRPVGDGANLTSTEVSSLLDGLNQAFSNDDSEDQNGFTSNISFRLAKFDDDGSRLGETGIVRFDASFLDTGFADASDVANDNRLGPNESWALNDHVSRDPQKMITIKVMNRQNGSSVATVAALETQTTEMGCFDVAFEPVFVKSPFNGPSLDFHYSAGARVLAHEIGHYLGLHHPFESRYGDVGDCVSDTFSYDRTSSDRSPSVPQKVPDLQRNIMDYDSSRDGFTLGQVERMHWALENALWINQLKFSTN